MLFLHSRGWCDGTGGNFSVCLQHDPLQLLMAPSGVDKGSVQAEELIVVDANGAVIEGNGRASAETELHLCIMSSVGAGAVLHTHSVAATVLSRVHSVLREIDEDATREVAFNAMNHIAQKQRIS